MAQCLTARIYMYNTPSGWKPYRSWFCLSKCSWFHGCILCCSHWTGETKQCHWVTLDQPVNTEANISFRFIGRYWCNLGWHLKSRTYVQKSFSHQFHVLLPSLRIRVWHDIILFFCFVPSSDFAGVGNFVFCFSQSHLAGIAEFCTAV